MNNQNKPRFDMYFAGNGIKDVEDTIVNQNINKLLSFINDRGAIEKYIEHKKNGWKGKLLIDSGAFSIHKSGKQANLDVYIDYLNKNHEYLDYYIQLDNIPGKWGVPTSKQEILESPEKTWQNYLYMRSKLIDKDKLLPVFHQLEDFKYLKRMLEYEDEYGKIKYMCIASNKQLSTNDRIDWYKRCFDIIERSNNPNIMIHSLGTQSKTHCEMFPFTSVDATSWIMTGANGHIYSPWGTVGISEQQFNRPGNVTTKSFYPRLLDYINKKGFNLEDLKQKPGERQRWNLIYLNDWAKNERVYKGPQSYKINTLF